MKANFECLGRRRNTCRQGRKHSSNLKCSVRSDQTGRNDFACSKHLPRRRQSMQNLKVQREPNGAVPASLTTDQPSASSSSSTSSLSSLMSRFLLFLIGVFSSLPRTADLRFCDVLVLDGGPLCSSRCSMPSALSIAATSSAVKNRPPGPRGRRIAWL